MGKNKNKSAPFRKRSHFQFERKGSFKKSKRHNSSYEQNSAAPDTADTVYRLLCPGRKIGSVIGKGGDIIKAMRDDTGAKIKVGEAVPGTDERVIIIFSSSTKKPRTDNTTTKDPDDPDNPDDPDDPNNPDNPNNPDDPDNPGNPDNPDNPNELEHEDPAEKELENMQPHCSAQDALLKVHERIAEDDELYGGTVHEDSTENDVVTARLLVPSNQVGCLLGKGGHIIQKLRSETGANIRILPAEHLPACAMSTDELVQISGISSVVKKALYDISTLLHQNPRPPMNHPMPSGGQGFYPPGPPMPNVVPQGNPMWSHRNSVGHPPPSMPWGGRYGNEPSGFGPGGFNGIPPGINGKTSDEFSMKILCSAERIGGVIGKGGSNVKQVQQETGASIHVEDTSPEADERVILVSSFDAPWNPRSPTIDAILLLQSKTNEISEKGITTRLLVPSSKVGCLLGQGGHIITEMRRRTRADIRIISKDGKPNCASTDEELVQISGNINVARDALSEVASRLRMRSLENVNASAEPAPVRPFQRYGPSESFFERGPPPSGVIRAGGSGGYEHVQGGGHEYEPQSYPVQPNATPGYPNMNSSMEVKIPNSAVGSVLAAGGSNISTISQMSGAKVKLNDPSSGTECVVEIHGSSEQMNAAQNLLQTFISNAVHNYHPHQQGPPPQQVHQQLPHQIPPQQPPQQQISHHVPQQFTHQQAPQQHSYHQYSQHISHQQVPQEQIPQQVQGLPQQIPYQASQPQHPQQGEIPQQIPYQVPQPQHPQQGEVPPQRILQQGPYQY